MLRTGMYLQDRYEIIELIGSGGMSDVYKAKCHKLNRLVAIKVLKKEFSTDLDFVKKFKMEAQAAAGLSHPNIVNIFDVVDEEDLHYIVMELIEGITLKSYIKKKGKLDVKESIGISIQVALGIEAAHEQNIIHRDIKPQNMIISKDGKVKVADFGIARAVTAQTITSTAVGSVHYISPEQAKGCYSDNRSDIYSLGITMYEMVTGNVPFEGDNTVSIALAHLEEPVINPSKINPEISTSYEDIIMKCVEKRPENRYQNIQELIADLRKALVAPDDHIENYQSSADVMNGDTIVIRDTELNQIKQARKQYRESHSKDNLSRKSEDVSSQLEKILAVGGVLVACIIVAVVIMVVLKLGGIFRVGSGDNKPSEAESSIEETLSDTQVYMPNIIGMPIDLAEKKLKSLDLGIKVKSYENSDEFDDGEIISQEVLKDSIIAKYSTVSVIVSKGSSKIDLSKYNLKGLTKEKAVEMLTKEKISSTVIEEYDDTVASGTVIRYSPEEIKEDEMVKLYVSKGSEKEETQVPSIKGLSELEAITVLSEAGLNPGEAKKAPSDTVEAGKVISQKPEAGATVEKLSSVSYVISSGVNGELQGTETGSNPVVSSTTVEETTISPHTTAAVISRKHYVASINETCDLSNLIGPASGSTNITVMIRLKQIVNGNPVYTVLMKPRKITGDVLLPIYFTTIEGATGVETGQIEVVETDSGKIIRSYDVTFFEM